MGFIYKVTNSVNGKVYIGQTMRTIPVRWAEHLRDSGMIPTQKPCSKHVSIFHQALRKYGVKSFVVCQVEECDDNYLDERERYWIKYYRSSETGYNIYKSSNQYKKCANEELLKLWNDGLLMKEIGEILKVHSETVAKRLKNIGISEQQILDRGNRIANKKKEKPVYQYDVDGNFVKEFSSLREAQESIGGQRIKYPPNAKGVTIAGYQWRKFKADKIESVRNKCRPNRKPLTKTA